MNFILSSSSPFPFRDEYVHEMFVSTGKATTELSTAADARPNRPVSNCNARSLSLSPPLVARLRRKLVQDSMQHERDAQQLYKKVNDLAGDKDRKRLFAVIQIGNEQRKVTTEDIICKVDEFHPTIGDRIRFEKVGAVRAENGRARRSAQVLLVGSSDFTVIGRPLLSPHFVRVEGVVIEKTLSQTQMDFWFAPKMKKVGQRQHRKHRGSLRESSE